MYVYDWTLLLVCLKKCVTQTSQLPENDRESISFKEYLASIDVRMGGRVAEELSKFQRSM